MAKNQYDKKDDNRLRGMVHIKFCKKANMFCKTTFPEGRQMQEWSQEKPKE